MRQPNRPGPKRCYIIARCRSESPASLIIIKAVSVAKGCRQNSSCVVRSTTASRSDATLTVGRSPSPYLRCIAYISRGAKTGAGEHFLVPPRNWRIPAGLELAQERSIDLWSRPPRLTRASYPSRPSTSPLTLTPIFLHFVIPRAVVIYFVFTCGCVLLQNLT